MAKGKLGIRRIHSLEICVHDAAAWLAYLTRGFGFQYLAVSDGQVAEALGTRRHLLACGDVRMVLCEAVHAGSFVRQYLEKHPEGIWRVNFQVEDIRATEEQLLERSATPIDFIQTERMGSAEFKHVSIATPLSDVEFGFIEASEAASTILPGMLPCGQFDAAANPLGITGIDHLTANVRTLMPVIAFYEHVMGFRRFWDVKFHTEELRPGVGSGLKSVVMWDEASGIKIANNEPLRPRFAASQIQLYIDINRGPGVQQLAFAVKDILAATEQCRTSGIQFLSTPPTYYEGLPARLKAQNISMKQDLEALRQSGILVDGDRSGYLMQIFCTDQGAQFQRPAAGPLFIELVQRCGCHGFGEGNFRALFEAMQKQTEQIGKV